VNLRVGSGTQAEQTAAIMVRYERLLLERTSDLCLVVGDVTSTMACAITARKLCVPVAHVEAGIRSGDWTMPEEINRMVTDSITNHFFTTSDVANANLRRSGVAEEKIHFVGNTMIDTLLANIGRLRPPSFWTESGLELGNYFVLTLHRPANVDPRTAKTLTEPGKLSSSIRLVEPQPYLEFNYLAKNAKAVITDSGGITEETTVMGVPCITLRDTTERPETVTIGTNELIGTDPARLKPVLDKLFAGRWKTGAIPEKWDGRTGERIVAILERIL
jgi:UDP-N-acetylglucosamine 2-epimerase (non-hydrolysing)